MQDKETGPVVTDPEYNKILISGAACSILGAGAAFAAMAALSHGVLKNPTAKVAVAIISGTIVGAMAGLAIQNIYLKRLSRKLNDKGPK